jgi:nucleoside-diphosphate-sugar epimerase
MCSISWFSCGFSLGCYFMPLPYNFFLFQGFQLAKKLATRDNIDSVVILQDDACNNAKEPFSLYGTDLPSSVTVIRAPLADESVDATTVQSWLNNGEDENVKFEYIFDNFSQGPQKGGKAICDCAQQWNCQLYVYVSSAGMYQPNEYTTFPMPEDTTPIKETAGQAQQDAYAVALGLPLVSFRPQYIYGPNSNKYDYLDWYFDRLVRKQPLPIPSPGTQKVSLTNSQDVAELFLAALDQPEKAIAQRHFNCGTDQLHTYDEVAYLCAEAAGLERVQIEHYDGEALGKGTFPFRMTDFYVAPDMAKQKLGYSGAQHDLKSDLQWYYEGYVARGGLSKDVDLSKDQEILGAMNTA